MTIDRDLSRPFVRFLAALLVLAALAACGPPAKIEPGWYRAVLTLPGGELPFGLELAQENGAWVGYLVNGPERVRVPEVMVDGRALRMTMPGFGNRLSAKRKHDRLEGEVVLVKAGGKEQHIPLVAVPGESYRFFKDPHTDNADVSGRWAVTFTDQDGKKSEGIAEFRQKFHEVTGTFLLLTGDHGYLAGEIRDNELHLSAFDGAHAFLYRATVTPSGELVGTYWSGLAWREEFAARRDEEAKLAGADSATQIRDETWVLGFTFPDESGQPVSFADRRFRNKIVIVTLAGSWCPNSHDEAAFLAPFYREQHAKGVEIVALMFEHFGDFEQAAQAVKSFRAKFEIEYPTLIAGISDKGEAAARLPQLNGVYAYPTTLFLDRRGRVRRIHTGFMGPATGVHHEELTSSFRQTVETLLAESS